MEMATELITQAGFKPFDDIPIEVVGLRPGEKLFEELISVHEESVATSHSSIKTLRSNYVYSVDQINTKINALELLDYTIPTAEVACKLKDIVPEYNYTPNDQPNGKKAVPQVKNGTNGTKINGKTITFTEFENHS